MRTRTFGFSIAGIGAAALLTACAGVSRLTPLSPAGAQAPHTASGWLSPQAKTGTAEVFVADQFNSRVTIFPQRGTNPAPIGEITDAVDQPNGVFVDRAGTLYVCNDGNHTVTEYPKGQTAHSKTLTGATAPNFVVVGHDGTVYVSGFYISSSGQVLEYAGGSTTPTKTIAVPKSPAGIALDQHDRLYVVDNDVAAGDVEVLRFNPGSITPKNLGIHLKGAYAGGATVDRSANLLVDDQILLGVDVFPPGAKKPSKQITGFPLADQIALNHRGSHLYVTDPGAGSVAEVAYPSGTPIQTIHNSLTSAFGVATSPL
jgi:hypothetical protein